MQPKPAALKILDVVSALLIVAATVMVFFYAPLEAVMGNVQRVFYFHVAHAWVGMLGFLVAAAMGVAYLRTGNPKWDVVEVAAVEISLVFFFVAIVTGSIWARPAWNTWWTWDPRLTTASIVELLYVAYMMLRSGMDDPDRRARFGAVYVILAFLSVPLTFISIRLLRTIHPVVIGGGGGDAQGGFDMTPKMLQTFFFSLFTFSVYFVDLLWHRIRLGNLMQKVEQLRLKVAR
ncbi:MAG: cytochrome C assembly protein [Anaerolineae bacterium]|nr:MAG: cytochrome C assembly protein [Anaerolineae bacterium]